MKQIYHRTEILPNDDIAICAYKLYFRFGNVGTVAEKLIDLGFSMPGKKEPTRKLVKNDIANIIDNSTIDDVELQRAVQELLKGHQNFTSKLH